MFPFWPNTTPQRANIILGTGLQRGIEDLQGSFISPEFRDTDVPIKGTPALSPQKTTEKNGAPVYGSVNNSVLFDMFYQSNQRDPASQVNQKDKPKDGK